MFARPTGELARATPAMASCGRPLSWWGSVARRAPVRRLAPNPRVELTGAVLSKEHRLALTASMSPTAHAPTLDGNKFRCPIETLEAFAVRWHQPASFLRTSCPSCTAHEALLLCACPACSSLVAVCLENAQAYATINRTAGVVETPIPLGSRCPHCGKVAIQAFETATPAEIQRHGLSATILG